MKSKHISLTQAVRHLIQLAAFILFPGLFLSAFSALGDIVKALATGTFSVRGLSAQLITVFGILAVTALWGRFFCGFLCSFGALQELASIPGRKLRPKGWVIPAKVDRVLKFLKYAVLAWIIATGWILAMPVDSSLSPWGVFGMLVSGNLSVASAAIPTVGFVLLMAILLANFFVERFFCRYFCPLGAVLALVSGKRLYKMRRKTGTCVSCGLCTKHCGMGIDVAGQEVVRSGECIDCMQCMAVCPCQSLSAAPAPAVAGTAASLVMCGLVTAGKFTVPASSSPDTYTAAGITGGSYPDGVYVGTGTGFRGAIEVQVTVKSGVISEITVLSHREDAEFFNRAKSNVISSILSSQSVEVDAVSGATFSSNGIMEAVANALGVSFNNPNASYPGGHGHGPRPGGGPWRHEGE